MTLLVHRACGQKVDRHYGELVPSPTQHPINKALYGTQYEHPLWCPACRERLTWDEVKLLERKCERP
jgi:hypothetical protein